MVTLQDVFIAKPVENAAEQAETGHRLLGPLTCTGIKPHFLGKMQENGVTLPPQFFQLENERTTALRAQAFGRVNT